MKRNHTKVTLISLVSIDFVISNLCALSPAIICVKIGKSFAKRDIGPICK